MKNQLKMRLFSIISILSMLLAAVGMPTGTVHAASPDTISGNAGVAGATITWNGESGDSDGSTTADGSGNYSFQVTYSGWFNYRWDGTVTPSKVGYSFSPTSRTYSISSDQTNQNYTATLANYTISGSVGSAGGGATITWDGSGSNPDGSTTANSSGSYSFTVPGGWSGTVTPSKAGYTFSPVNRSYTNVGSNQSNQNYTATLVTYTISGNAGVGNATITYTGGSTTANSSGSYSFTVSLGWSGTVTPSRTGYSFVPPNRSYTNVTANQSAQDYTARPTSFTFGSMADGQAQPTYFSPTADQLASLNPALVLYVGDLEENGFLTSEANPMVSVLKSENLFNKTFLVRGNGDNHVANSATLWENYFETSPNVPSRPAFVVNKVALNSSSDNLTYSFDYGNSIFIGVDAPGDIDYLEQNELDFINARLTYAEGAGLTHAFLFFHGPAYPVESVHSICPQRADATCTPPALMTIINNHPIVSATFHGHEHVLAWTHMDATRVDTLTRSYEQFVTSPAGGSSYHEYLYPERVDYAYTDMENSMGFATVAVNGLEFTVRFYKTGTSQPVWTHTFSKVNTPPTISNITDQTTAEDTATATIPFTVGDVETNTDYLTVTATSSDTTLVPNDHIALNGSGANRTLNITPALNQSGTATITVSVNDGNVTVEDTFVLTVNPVNDAPVADPQSLSMLWNTSLNIVLTGSDVENSPLTFGIVDDPAHGTLTGSGANRTYTPAAGYSGPDSFTFKVNDTDLDSAPATVSLLVTAHTISGNAGVAGATLSYMDGTTPKTVTADGAGAYSFQVPAGWSGTVTPAKAGYYFSPASMTYTDVQADQPDQNYSVSVVMIVISGNAGVAGATLSYNDGTPKTVTSDESGLYSFEVPYNWSGMVTPSKTGYGFRPGTTTYTNVIEDRYAEDYTTTSARVWYVDKTNPACTDVGQVGSFAQPFCTITRGAYLAQPGQIVHVLHGTYAETVYPERSGTSGSPISYWGDPGVVVTGQPGTASVNYAAFALGARNYIVIDGFRIDNTSYKGIYVDGSHHVTITNNHVTRAGNSSLYHPYEQGIYTRNTSNSTISGNITDHNTCIGIRVVGGDHNLISNNTSFSNYSVVETDAAGIELTGSSYNTVINNLTYSNEDTGINVYLWDTTVDVQSTYNLVINNLSYENGDHGIDVNNSPYNTFIGNTVHGNGTVGINIEGEATTGSHHSTVFNNISVGNGFTPPAGSFGGNMRVDTPSVPGTVLDYNLYNKESAVVDIVWDNTNYASLAAFKAAVPTQEVHGIEADPLFVDPVPPALRETGVPYEGAGILGNYYPMFGSPAIDSANSSAPSQQATDIDGNSRIDDPGTPNTGVGVRTYDDRGAYEYLPSGPSLPVVTTQAVTNISETTATCNGTITATGLPNPTQHGCVWATHSVPTTDDNKTSDGAVTSTGAFTSSITGLTPGTLYYVRAYATNSVGTVYGAEVILTAHLLPTVLTQAVTSIGTTTAIGNGDITSLGVPNPTQHGVVWSTSPNPTTADNKTEKGTVSAIGAFTSNITGLTPGTLYYIRAYVTNAAGTVYGNDFTFTTHVEPTVTTQAVTNITQTTATGNGNIDVLGIPNPTQHGMVWGTSPNPTTANNKTTNGPVSATGAFTSNLTGLTPGTLYYVRAYATNETGTVYGGEVTFTAQQLPTVTTQAATNITTTTATGNGNITGLGVPNPTEHGVVWSTAANPTTADSKTTDGAVSATGTFISSISGLTPGTLYHVRAYATNAAGTVYGNDVTFTTDILPTVTTQAVTAITQTTATGHGNVTALGMPNPTEHGVVWSTVSNPTTADSKTTDGPVSATGAFTSSILGLTPGTLYHVRAYATNEVGTVYGEDVTFTTLLLPTVTTQDVTTITTSTATGNGNVTALGIPNPTQHGFVWSTSPNPTTANSKTTNGPVSVTGVFTGNITGLAEGTLYHVRAYATNAAGTVYGEDVTFTTLLRPTVTTQAATDVTQTTATGNGNITVLGSTNPTEHGLVWSTSANPTTADNKTTDGAVTETGAFTGSLTGLTPGTLYHVRAYAINAAGTSYGEDVTFTTLLLPTVTTLAATDITETTATGNGNIDVLGIPNPTQHGVVWSTSPNPTTADSKTTDGAVSVTGAFTSSMTGLTIGTQYYVRAYATNAAGTVYGNEVTFTTTSSSSGTTTPATNAGSGNDVSGTGTAVWLNPGFITTDDNNYAQVTVGTVGGTPPTTSHYLYGTDYGFTIPANAIINGIQVTIGRYESGQQAGNDVRDNVVRLLKGGVVVGGNKAVAGTEWPTTEANAVYGSNNDLWGTTWTAGEINASDFGVALSVNSANNRIAYVDFMQISVTYTVTKVGSLTSVNCGAGTPVVVYGSSITCVATVTRGSGTFTPTGDVNWTTNGGGSFSPTSCSVAGTNGVATCSVSYTPIAVGSGSDLITANYAGDLSFYASNDDQTVTVNKKDASVTPNAASKLYGDPDPELTGTLTGFLPADSVTAMYSREAGETIEGSPYTISATLSPAGALANYNIIYNTADFTITSGEYTLTINVVGSGTITRTPNQDVYHYDDVVTLIPAPDAGWTFDSWSENVVDGKVIIRGDTTVTASFTPVEVAPTFTSTPITSVDEDAPYAYNIIATDPNAGDTLTITAPTKPQWLIFTDNGGGSATLTGTPTNNEVGDHPVVLRVSDGTLTTDQPFSITVINTNDAPSFTSTPVTDAEEDALYTYEITVTDPDAGAILSITAPTVPAWLTIADNGDGTALLSGTPTNADVGIHNVTLQVDDGTIGIDQIFTIDVGNLNDGPSFTSTPVENVNEDAVYTYEITATDPDTGDLLEITATTILPAWLTLTDHNDRTATLTGSPANGDVGTLAVTLQVSDTVELASQPFTITVANVNDAPVLTQPADQTNEQGDTVSLQLSATDIDLGDTLTYSADGLPEGLSLDTETGLITGTITGAIDTYTVTAGVDDGNGGTDSRTFSWNVTPPTYTLTINIIGNGTVTKDPDQTSYLNGAEVALTAEPAAGWRLDHWSENVVDGTVTISGDTTVTVTFVQIEYTLTVNTVGNGHVTRDNPGPYHLNDVVTLTAVADEGWSFASWTGCTGTDNTCLVTIDGDKTVTANFGLFPGAFTKLSPVNGATNVPTSLTLYWTASSGMTSYEYCLDTTNDNTCTSSWVNNGNQRSVTLSGLNNNTTYYWQVRAKNSAGSTYADGSYGAFWSFTVKIPPGAFTKLSPANGIQNAGTSLTLYWNASSGMTSYEYCLDTTNDNACTSSWVNNGNQRSVTLTGLNNTTTYYWQVRAKNANGTTYADGAVTAFWSFTVNVSPGAFTKTAPANAMQNVGTSVTLYWSASPYMTSYEYCLDTTNDNACTSSWVSNNNLRSVTLSNLTRGTTYYWQVRAKNSVGSAYADGAVTAFWSFTVNAAPDPFTKLAPATGATIQGTGVTLYWSPSVGMTSYEYCLDTTNDNACTSSWVSNANQRSVSLTGLNPGTTYYWQVRAKNSTGTTYADGAVGSFWSFTISAPPGAFSKTAPANGTQNVGTSVTLYWATSANRTSFEYCYDTTDDGQCSNWVSTGTTRSITISGLELNTTYYWQVRARNNSGITYANEGIYWAFTTRP